VNGPAIYLLHPSILGTTPALKQLISTATLAILRRIETAKYFTRRQFLFSPRSSLFCSLHPARQVSSRFFQPKPSFSIGLRFLLSILGDGAAIAAWWPDGTGR